MSLQDITVIIIVLFFIRYCAKLFLGKSLVRLFFQELRKIRESKQKDFGKLDLSDNTKTEPDIITDGRFQWDYTYAKTKVVLTHDSGKSLGIYAYEKEGYYKLMFNGKWLDRKIEIPEGDNDATLRELKKILLDNLTVQDKKEAVEPIIGLDQYKAPEYKALKPKTSRNKSQDLSLEILNN